jgi:hypothetical protein
MTLISSKWTFFYKKAFPIFWFGFIAVFIGTGLASGAVEKNVMFLVMPLILAVFGFFLFRKLVWDLADEVLDGGDFLVVRRRGYEEQVPLSNIMNVNASTMTNPPRISLRLVQAGRFGSEIVFSPKRSFTLNPFAKSEVAEDLIVRVDKARSRRAA